MESKKLSDSARKSLEVPVGSSYTQGGIRRTVLERCTYPQGYTVNLNLIEVQKGRSANPHTHPGLEVTYVLEGEFDLVTEGKEDRHFTQGMSYMVSDSEIHFARVTGDKSIKLLCVFINKEGEPVANVVGKAEVRD